MTTPATPAPVPAPSSVRAAGSGRARRARDRTWRQLAIPLPTAAFDQLGAVRRLTCTNLIAWGVPEPRAEQITLVLSELVTNALLHTAGPARIRLHIRNRIVFLHVSDTSDKPAGSGGPRLQSDGPHGRGLPIVEHLAERVSTRIHPGLGKTVTAEFDLD